MLSRCTRLYDVNILQTNYVFLIQFCQLVMTKFIHHSFVSYFILIQNMNTLLENWFKGVKIIAGFEDFYVVCRLENIVPVFLVKYICFFK